jgi:pyruvate,water dikinase
VISEGSAELLDYYRRFDPSLSDDRLFIEVFDHRPMINLSLMTDFMRSLGLPTRLVTDSIGGGAEEEGGLDVRRLMRRLLVLLKLAWGQVVSSRYARKRLEDMRTLTRRPATSASQCVDRARQVYVATVHGMTALNTAAAGPTALLRAAGTLEAHIARQETDATVMFRELDGLRTVLTDDDRSRLEEGSLPESTAFLEGWQRWIDRYGHRGPYESDLSRKRYVDDPTPIFDVLVSGSAFHHQPPRRTLGQVLSLPLWWIAHASMARRERFRSEAMKIFLSLRRSLLLIGTTHDLAEDELWLLKAEEVRRLDEGWKPDRGVFRERAAELEEARSRPMPDLISRFGSHREDSSGGVGLVAGIVEGRAWVLHEPSTRPPATLRGAPIVLVAPSVDAGWLPTFALVDAAAVEMGGDLSHGSIILREVGLPAVTNVGGLRRQLQTGDWLRVDGNTGAVELLTSP